MIIVWSSNFSFYKNSGSSKRFELSNNLIVDFKIDRFVLTLKYSDPCGVKFDFLPYQEVEKMHGTDFICRKLGQ